MSSSWYSSGVGLWAGHGPGSREFLTFNTILSSDYPPDVVWGSHWRGFVETWGARLC